MKPTVLALVATTLLAIGSAVWIGASEQPKRKPYPKPTPPPPPSSIYHDVNPAPSVDEVDREAREHVDEHVHALTRVLAGGDELAREVVFTFVLPELLQVAPQRVTDLFATLGPGKARDRLLTEVARQWIVQDPAAATRWIESLTEKAERRAGATTAVRTLAPIRPDQALRVAEEFDVRND